MTGDGRRIEPERLGAMLREERRHVARDALQIDGIVKHRVLRLGQRDDGGHALISGRRREVGAVDRGRETGRRIDSGPSAALCWTA